AQIDGYRAALAGFIDSMTMVKRDKSALFEQTHCVCGAQRVACLARCGAFCDLGRCCIGAS
ncbi:hypothetical protein, partial [Kingella kingae]|uniref:hypothetical protein n=1 Tax=Kingella kingae TaxID=504 RepID=UPI0039AFF4F5